MRHIPLKAVLSFSLLAAASSAEAATLLFATHLTGAEEVPPVTTTGRGIAAVFIDDVERTMLVGAQFRNLMGPTAAAHIHCCAPFPTNASPATTVPSFPEFPLGVTAGTYAGIFDMNDPSSYSPGFLDANGGTTDGAFSAFLAGLVNEQAYFNIHTSLNPGGEIRGQLSVVPEPSTWAMLLLGFGAVGGAIRSVRRKQKLTVSYA